MLKNNITISSVFRNIDKDKKDIKIKKKRTLNL